jgi:acyl carrier protein
MVFTSFNTPSISGEESVEVRIIRALVAKYLDVDVSRVTDEAHFRRDLGADWLDRLELLIEIGDQFSDVEITDDDADQFEVVGDLIRYVGDARGQYQGTLHAF